MFDDADLDAAVAGAMASKYRNAGQTCVCANRLLVQDGVYDAFAAKLAEAVKTLKVGDGMEAGVTTGPLINRAAVAKVEEHIKDALAKGAKLALGGNALGGNFFEPTLLTEVTSAMAVAREETFGPVAPLFRFKTENEAIEMANATEFGLACYSTPATSAAFGGSPKGSSAASSGSTKASSRPPRPRSAASSRAASAARARATASRSISK